MSGNSFLRDSVCAVCWVKKSARSKSLSEVTTRIQDIIKLFISSRWFDKVLTEIFAKIDFIILLDYLNHAEQNKLKSTDI